MKEFDSKEFDARREECGQATRNVLDFLKVHCQVSALITPR
jgi:hypothetical protein